MLSDADALALAELPPDEGLADLLAAARRVRDARYGIRVTYSPKVFIPLTMLCRDVCHYCTFARPPKRGERAYLTVDEAVEIARQGAEAGCREALFTLGDKPELRYRAAREELASLGFETTAAYLAHVAGEVLRQTGLLPHANPGILDDDELLALREVCASQGIMLETTSDRLSQRGGAHFGSPDKVPSVRIDAIARAGRLRIPYTSGILIGIGETRRERVEALIALRDLHLEHGHLQEIIVQNFRAKAGTKMADAAEPTLDDHLWTIAVARLVLPPEVSVQAPPNLSGDEFPALLAAGIDDFGGISPVTPDHVNPEAPWPDVARLEAACAAAGRTLLPRLAVYPEFLADPETWLVRTARAAPRSPPRTASGSPGASAGRPAPCPSRRPPGARVGVRSPSAASPPPSSARSSAPRRARCSTRTTRRRCSRRAAPRSSCSRAAADRRRFERAGDRVTYVVCRNVNYTNVCYFKCGFCAFSKGKLAENLRGPAYLLSVDEVARRAVEAWSRGATEVCLQGGIHPGFSGRWYLELLRAVKEAVPVDPRARVLAARGLAGRGDRGVGSRRLPDAAQGGRARLAARHRRRDPRRRRAAHPLPRQGLDRPVARGHAHGARRRPALDGDDDVRAHREPAEPGAGTCSACATCSARRAASPSSCRCRSSPTRRRSRCAAARAAARRSRRSSWCTPPRACCSIPGSRTSRPRGSSSAPRAHARCSRPGVDDLGGTLMNESISRAAGAAHGQECPPEVMEAAIHAAERTPAQRTTLYADAPADRVAASFGAAELEPTPVPPYDDGGLERPRRLIRPGLVGVS